MTTSVLSSSDKHLGKLQKMFFSPEPELFAIILWTSFMRLSWLEINSEGNWWPMSNIQEGKLKIVNCHDEV